MEWLLRLLFFRDVTRDEVEVAWPPRLPGFDSTGERLLLLLLAAAAVAAVIWFYRREPGYVSRARKRVLAGLRIAALLAILLILSGASLDLVWEEESRGTVVVLVDSSRSMGIADKRTTDEELLGAAIPLGLGADPSALGARERERIAGATRADLVRHALADDELSVLDELAERYRLAAFTFGERATASPLELALDAEGGPLAGWGAPEEEATQLGGALRDVVAKTRGRYVAGVLALTDGGSNRGEDPLPVAQELQVPLYTVGVGLPQTRDIEIPFLFAEDVVFKGDTFPLHVRVKQRGYAGRSARLTIRRDDEIVDERTIRFDERTEVTHVVELTPDREGVFTYRAEIDPQDDEMSVENNRKERHGVRVVDKRIQVLAIDDAPRWEFRYLMSVLEADRKRLEPTFVLRQADEDLVARSRGRFLPHFPGRAEHLRRYNLVILGDIVPEFFTREELALLERYVREEGGALLVMAGRHMPGDFHASPLADLLPIEFPPHPAVAISDPRQASITTGFRPRLTLQGRRSSLLRLAVETDRNERLWAGVDELHWYFPAERLKPGATALLEHPAERGGGQGRVPLVAQHRYGKGQVLFVGVDETWRWRHRPGPAHHRRLWGQAVGYLSLAHLLGASNRIQIDTDRSEYVVGEEVQIVARVLDANYRPVAAEAVEAVIERGDLQRTTVSLAAQEGQPGVFQGPFVPAATGRHRITIAGEEREAEHYVQVGTPRLEFDDPGLREELLRQLAAATGGAYAPLHEMDSLAEHLQDDHARIDVRREERTLWDAPGLIVLVTLLLGLEWFIRKRSDLL